MLIMRELPGIPAGGLWSAHNEVEMSIHQHIALTKKAEAPLRLRHPVWKMNPILVTVKTYPCFQDFPRGEWYFFRRHGWTDSAAT